MWKRFQTFIAGTGARLRGISKDTWINITVAVVLSVGLMGSMLFIGKVLTSFVQKTGFLGKAITFLVSMVVLGVFIYRIIVDEDK